MDLVDLEGLERREIFDVKSCKEAIDNRITRTLLKSLDLIDVHDLLVPEVKSEELVTLRVSECQGVDLILQLELACGCSLIRLKLRDIVDVQPLSLIDYNDVVFRDGGMH